MTIISRLIRPEFVYNILVFVVGVLVLPFLFFTFILPEHKLLLYAVILFAVSPFLNAKISIDWISLSWMTLLLFSLYGIIDVSNDLAYFSTHTLAMAIIIYTVARNINTALLKSVLSSYLLAGIAIFISLIGVYVLICSYNTIAFDNYMTGQKNYKGIVLSILLVLSVFQRSIISYSRYFLAFCVFIFLYVHSIRGCMILCSVIISAELLRGLNLSNRIKVILFLFLGVITVSCLYDFNIDIYSSRYYDVVSSIELLKANMPFGVGSGQWAYRIWDIDLYQYYPTVFYYNKILQPEIHNFHFKRLAEWGIMSSIFYLPLVVLFFRRLKDHVGSSYERLISYALILIFISQFIYRTANHHLGFYSSVEIMFFVFIGMLRSQSACVFSMRGRLFRMFLMLYAGLILFVTLKMNDSWLYTTKTGLRCDSNTVDEVLISDAVLLYEMDLDMSLSNNPNCHIEFCSVKLFSSEIDNLFLESIDYLQRKFQDENEVLMLLIEYNYLLKKFSETSEFIEKLENKKHNAPYVPYLWFYKMEIASMEKSDLYSFESWRIYSKELKTKLDEHRFLRSRNSRDLIKIKKEMLHFLRRDGLIDVII